MGRDQFTLASGALVVSTGRIGRDRRLDTWLGTLAQDPANSFPLASFSGVLLMLWPAETAAMVTPGTDAYSML